MNIEQVASRFNGFRQVGSQYEALCPIHDDHHASLSIGEGEGGRILVHCHTGCPTPDVIGAVGLTMADLMPPLNGSSHAEIAATYDYRSDSGELLYQVVRFAPKTFRQRRPKAGGGWTWNLNGVQRVLYRLPELNEADPHHTVFIPEGEKDVDRLRARGLTATTNSGGAGAGKWQAQYNAALADRNVVILPDNDESGRTHSRAIAESLHALAHAVRILELPNLPAKGDVSDWLNAGGTAEQLLQFAEATRPWTPGDVLTAPRDKAGGTIKRLADAICAQERFAQDDGGKLYCYADGAYRPKGEETIRRLVKSLANEFKVTEEWSRALAENVVEYIRVDSPLLWSRPPADVLNVKNGLLDISTRQLRPHDPAHLSPVQLPVGFDTAATCPAIEAFVGEVFPADATSLAWEIPAYLMLPDTSIQKAVLGIGPGGNGKSTYLNVVVEFLGRINTSALSLHKIESDRFATARLYGKLANICPDLPSEHLAGTSVFKSITGGDPLLTGEHKFKDSFDFTPFCRLVFSANNPPRSPDASQGFFERWLVIPFERSFRGTTAEVSRKVLDSRLTTPAELSGLLNKALAALPRITAGNGFTNPASVQRAVQEFQATTDPLAVWLDRFTVDDPEAYIVKKTLRIAFNTYLESKGKPSMTETGFGLAFQKLRPTVDKKQRTMSGKLEWCYIGIGLRSSHNEDSHT